MTFNIETAFLDDDEAERIDRSHPELMLGVCPTCRGAKTYRWQGNECDCNCQRQLQLALHYAASGIGVTYQRLDWADYEGDPALLPHVLKYLERHDDYIARGVGLLFHGGIGLGKTLVANLVLKELIKRGYTCFATTFANAVEAFTASWRSSERKEWFADKFMYSKVLLLDDLGRELRTSTNLPQSTFDMILRTRVAEGRPTVLTTNCTLGELSTGYGAQVLSQLSEQSLVFEFTGEDYRPKARRRTVDEIERGEIRPII